MVAATMTAEEFLALPDDRVKRWLIRGLVRDNPEPFRDHLSAGLMAQFIGALQGWLERQTKPRGMVLAANATHRFPQPDTIIGPDVAYLSPAQVASLAREDLIVPFPPTLAVEILSPSDTIERINEKLELYMEAGVPLVWVINGYNRTVEVHRPGKVLEFFTTEQELTAEPHLPGFRVPVAGLFEDL